MKQWVLATYRVAVLAGLVWSAHPPTAPATTAEESPRVLRTSPLCDDIVGYAGANDCEIHLDETGRLEAVRLLRSGDTAAHVAAVRADPEFLASFAGRSIDGPDRLASIDGVSRATLTSLAIVEAVIKRLSGRRPSLRFPAAIELAEVRRIWPNADRLLASWLNPKTEVHGTGDIHLGYAVRTGPLSTAIVGYQGPSDTLLLFDRSDVLRGFALRRSYDHEKYVDYVNHDHYFAEQFLGLPLTGLATRPAVDGVSGATMTSQAIARGIAHTCARLGTVTESTPEASEWPALWARDGCTLVAILLAVWLTFSRLRGHRRARIASRIAIILYFGIISGDMLSQGLLVGWMHNGLPAAAPGLIALGGTALLIPVTTGRQTYCHQLCAHGALLDLLRRSPWRRPMPRRLSHTLRHLPATLLAVVVLFALACGLGAVGIPVGIPAGALSTLDTLDTLDALEPFGAWAWPLAGVATCMVFVVSCTVSSFYPMAYCRVGCPTGALLDFVRRRGAGDRFRVYDATAGTLLVLVAVSRTACQG